MAWYPSGSSDADKPSASFPPPSSHTQETVVTSADDDDPTVAQPGLRHDHGEEGVDVDEDELTLARPSLSRSLPPAPDEDTVNDDDPTVNRQALSRTTPAAELLDQRYQLLGQIGAGGMGEVWRARHVALARDVAVKFLTNDDGGPRFRQEAQAIAAVHHTGVVSVLDFGETDQSVPYFVMELIEGETLSARVRRQGPLSWALVRNIALEISDALAHAHAVGVIHRDLKPSNVIVLDSPPARGSSTKLIDFGIAKLLDSNNKLTKTGFIQGTPAYMSPEQVLGEAVDARSDVYGLGCLMYYLLSGHRPFPDKTGTAALRAQIYELPPRLTEALPGHGIPPDVDSVVFRAIAKDPSARFASMSDMLEAIYAIPPDAGASMSMPNPPSGLRPTDSHSSGAGESWGASSSSSSSSGPRSTTASYTSLSQSQASVSGSAPNSLAGQAQAQPRAQRGTKLAPILLLVGAVVLVAAAVIGLIWALTT